MEVRQVNSSMGCPTTTAAGLTSTSWLRLKRCQPTTYTKLLLHFTQRIFTGKMKLSCLLTSSDLPSWYYKSNTMGKVKWNQVQKSKKKRRRKSDPPSGSINFAAKRVKMRRKLPSAGSVAEHLSSLRAAELAPKCDSRHMKAGRSVVNCETFFFINY